MRNEVSTLKVQKDDPNKSSPLINLAESMADYQSKIRKLEEVPFDLCLGNRRRVHIEGETDEGVRDRQEFL